jgi:Surface antigen variable number repeat
MVWVSHVIVVALLLLVTLNVQSSAAPQNEAQGRCGQTVAEQTPLLREAIDNHYTLRRIEFTGNETIRDYVLRRRVVLREGDFFSQQNLVKSLSSLNKLKQLYALTMKDVIIQLDKPDKLVDVTLCFRERQAGPKRAS